MVDGGVLYGLRADIVLIQFDVLRCVMALVQSTS